MDQLVPVVVMALVQGIAEFLPISSSGHLIVTAALFEQAGRPLPDVFGLTVLLHVGTLLSIVVYYWQRLWRLLGEDRRVIGLVIVGTIPAVIAGLFLKYSLGSQLESPLLVGCMWPLTALWLWWGSKQPAHDTDYAHMSYRQALGIGLVQAVAILPGISRSGSTIVAGLLLGLRRDAAANFSFLLALPVTTGACLLEGRDIWKAGLSGMPVWLLLVGTVVSFGSGLLALDFLLRWLNRGKLYHFALWCLFVGLGTLIWQGFIRTSG